MPEISASEYLNSLLVAYQNAERTHSQAVADVVAAEIRRDEAQKAKDDALARLEEARTKYSSQSSKPADTGKQPIQRKKSGEQGRKKTLTRHSSGKASNVPRKGDESKTHDSPAMEASKAAAVPGPPPLESKSSTIVLSPRAGSKKAPKIFSTGGKASIRTSSIAGVLVPLNVPRNVLEIAKGRSREWYGRNFDCQVLGVVKKFYLGAFGTKTNEQNKKVTVQTIVLNDEWNDLVSETNQIQELYIGSSTDKDAKVTMRDKAAEALVNPPQKDPVALFFAPKNATGSSDIFYGGHWQVVDGKMLHPPRSVKGQPRQCLAKFQFVGINEAIVETLNRDVD
eukprot:Nitzschia sp. Nitz4//scaffold48_size128905//118304//119320//NITZ4_003621-RA/size128905-processed-gene-0.125-mRNA-1//-1//CDS//3329553045//7012//frame0